VKTAAIRPKGDESYIKAMSVTCELASMNASGPILVV
jgi:hypothetical protein